MRHLNKLGAFWILTMGIEPMVRIFAVCSFPLVGAVGAEAKVCVEHANRQGYALPHLAFGKVLRFRPGCFAQTHCLRSEFYHLAEIYHATLVDEKNLL